MPLSDQAANLGRVKDYFGSQSDRLANSYPKRVAAVEPFLGNPKSW